MIKIRHTSCDQVAFLYDHIPTRGEKMVSTSATKPDGSPIDKYDTIKCYSCNQRIEGPDYLSWPKVAQVAD